VCINTKVVNVKLKGERAKALWYRRTIVWMEGMCSVDVGRQFKLNAAVGPLVEVNQTLTLVACVAAAGWLVGLVLLALVCAFVCVPSCLRPVLG
jgi:hypothetical protein